MKEQINQHDQSARCSPHQFASRPHHTTKALILVLMLLMCMSSIGPFPPSAFATPGSRTSSSPHNDETVANFKQEEFQSLLGQFTEQQTLTLTGGLEEDRFGNSVAISGNTAIIGAGWVTIAGNRHRGAAYVYTRTGQSWSLQQTLTASDGAANDEFGSSVAINGDTAIVGAFQATVGGHQYQGAAYVFTRSGNTWAQQQKLTAGDNAAGFFGFSMAMSSDTAIIGAVNSKIGTNSGQGASYVFVKSGNSWSEQQKLSANDGVSNSNFGVSVGISGDTVIIGAHGDPIEGNVLQGAAYIFTRSGSAWSQHQKLTTPLSLPYKAFGYSVGINGDTVVVGALQETINGKPGQGSAYVFVRTGNTWTQQQRLTASDGASGDNFGFAVAISNESIVVTSPYDDVGEREQGSAYVFARTGASWLERQRISHDTCDFFGSAVATNGDSIIVGNAFDNINNIRRQGSATIFVAPVVNFDLCLQDESADSLLQINTATGEYQFTSCGTKVILGGSGRLSVKGSSILLTHEAADRQVSAKVDMVMKRATASIQLLSAGQSYIITDRDISNNSCTCQ
jgi:hypothetical protein